jgi:hypothetical protein
MIFHHSGVVLVIYQQLFFKDPIFSNLESYYTIIAIFNDILLVLFISFLFFTIKGYHTMSTEGFFFLIIRISFLIFVLFLYYCLVGFFKLVQSGGELRLILIGFDYFSNVLVELFIFLLLIFNFRYKSFYTHHAFVGKIWIFLLHYLTWYNYLQALFDIIYDSKEGVHQIPLRSTGLSITVTCKSVFAYMLQIMANRGIKVLKK